MSRRVVVTGMGAVTPLGVGARKLYERWVARESGIEDGIGRCTDFDPSEVLSKKEMVRTQRFTQLGIAAAQEAIAEATKGGDAPFSDADRVGCIIGAGGGGVTPADGHGPADKEDWEVPRVSPFTVPKVMSNAPAGMISIRYGLRGPAFAVVSACASGTDAIGTALRFVRSGASDAVVTGGTESSLTGYTIKNFAAMQATSRCGISRPFDARRDGFILAEGAGVLVLEDRDVAIERGAEILGEVLGYGSSSDAYHVVAPDPSGGGAALAMRRALTDASLSPEEIDYVNAHGTSTPLNDRAETAALKVALGDAAAQTPISSTKSAIGHLIGAAGAVEAIATLLALDAHTAPPTINYSEVEEGLDLDYVPDGPRPLRTSSNGSNGRPAIGLSNSFGFGGHNSVLCLSA